MGNDWRMHPLLSLQIYFTERGRRRRACECVSASACVRVVAVVQVLGARAEERDRESTCVVASFIPSQAAHAGRHSLKTALHFHLLLPLSRRARERC